jgi:EpsI family protein
MRNQSQETLKKTHLDKNSLRYNRFQAIKGKTKLLVYYWYQQRGRNVTNEFLLKWYLFWDAVIKNRTDGALIRITTELNEREVWGDADKRLLQFISKLEPILPSYLPD